MLPQKTFDPKQMQQAAGTAAELLKVLANPNRLVLLCLMTQGELSVSDLEARSGITQPSLSQQLGVLRQKQLVVTRKEGKQVYYQLCHPEALALLGTLYALYCAPNTQPSDPTSRSPSTCDAITHSTNEDQTA